MTSGLNIKYGSQGLVQLDSFILIIMFRCVSKIASLKTDMDGIYMAEKHLFWTHILVVHHFLDTWFWALKKLRAHNQF